MNKFEIGGLKVHLSFIFITQILIKYNLKKIN